MSDTDQLHRSPLDAVHEAAGASFTDFAGWRMPVRYGSDLAEHEVVRTAAGIFDLSHMAQFLIEGTHAAAFLDYALAGWASRIAVGRARYSLLLAEDAGVLDDLIVYRLRPDRFLVVANAANREVVADAFVQRKADFDVVVEDATGRLALIAVQGPHALRVIEQLATPLSSSPPAADVGYYGIAEGTWSGVPVLVARTGYTGEDGFELSVDASAAPRLWAALVAAGATPCGLAARDTLRLEAGMALYGHELGREIHPAQAGLDRVVPAAKPGQWIGKAAFDDGPPPGAPVLVGLIAEGRRAGRAGYPVLRAGVPVGEVTSGALSPTLQVPIAMAYVPADAAEIGTGLEIDVRGTAIPARVVPLPFYNRKALS